ncbi:MAG: ABC transporter ATP-binding protein [Chloroflexi bacterium]|nr:ABC transporter ATP-binding protein [Chloroflexota bacterium]
MFAVRFENVSKVYRIGRQRHFTALFANWAGTFAGKGGGRPRHWALEDVSFELQEGDSLGMVGPNGAGKTTILKLLSRVTWPTAGRVVVAGKVISLIELGAGFHAELTGRENIFLHAAILGLSRAEVAPRLDAIVAFAGIEKFVDTPVKWYSSGMYARLGFAVAAFSDPDVLLVDEVLAVGDTAFQRKAIDKMREFVQGGKTVILVSHDLGNVRGLCKQVLWLEKGKIRALGPTEQVVADYLDDVNRRAAAEQGARDRTETRGGSGDARFGRVALLDAAGRQTDVFQPGEPIRIRAEYRAFRPLERPIFRFALTAPRQGVTLCATDSYPADVPEIVEGEGIVECTFEAPPLQPGLYSTALSILGPDGIALYDSLGVTGDFVIPASARTGNGLGGGFVIDRGDLIRVPARIQHHAGMLSDAVTR